MSEIKYKGKRVDTGEWVYGFPVIHNNGTNYTKICEIFTGISGYGFNEGLNFERFEVYPDTFCQFTELHDKNGGEIYKSDIVHVDKDGHVWSIEYDSDEAKFIAYNQINSERDIEIDCATMNLKVVIYEGYEFDLEVIGNVKDNI